MWLLFHATRTRTGSHSGLIKLPPKNTKGEPSNGRLAFLHIVSWQSVFEWGRLIIPKQQAPPQKAGDSRLFGVKIS